MVAQLNERQRAIDWLGVVDLRLQRAAGGPLLTLAPDRESATALATLGEQLLLESDPDPLANAFGRGLGALAIAQLDAFPGNLFWDLDFVAARVLAQGREAPEDGAGLVDTLFALMAELQHLYGRHTTINFSYVHDFTYGYDWSKWVLREDSQGGRTGPFDLGFLEYMKRRAHELMQLIATNDRKYPTLPDGEARNPFPFSREPDAERRLLPELARRGLIPVETWRTDAEPDCGRDFYALRVDVARELGI